MGLAMATGFELSALRVAIAAIPPVLIMLFAGLVALALVMDRERREYALDFARICTDLTAVLVSGYQTKMVPERQSPKSVKNSHNGGGQ